MAEYMDAGARELHAETSIYKCPGCGADMVFDPKSQKLRCEHCGTEKSLNALGDVRPIEYIEGAAGDDGWDAETAVFCCPNCGGKEVIARGEIAKSCPFCGATHVISTAEIAGIKPNAVVPFFITEQDARSSFHQWIKKRWFVPNALKKQAKIVKASGVYSPTWIFDCSASCDYEGRLGEYVTRTVGSGKNRRTVTEIRWFHVSGTYDMDYADLMVEASPQITQKELNAVKPFSLDRAVVYEKGYLAGFAAEHYDKSVDDAWSDSERIIEEDLRSRIKSAYGADVVDYLNLSVVYTGRRYRYTLVPLYLANYAFKEKKYRFIVNGTTGKVTGKVPRSPLKITFFVLGLLAILIGIGALISMNGGL